MPKKNINDDPPTNIIDMAQRIARLEESMEWVKSNMATKSDISSILKTIATLKWGIGIGFSIITIVLTILTIVLGG